MHGRTKWMDFCETCLPLPQQQCDECDWDDDLDRPDGYIHEKTWKKIDIPVWQVLHHEGWVLREYEDRQEAAEAADEFMRLGLVIGPVTVVRKQ